MVIEEKRMLTLVTEGAEITEYAQIRVLLGCSGSPKKVKQDQSRTGLRSHSSWWIMSATVGATNQTTGHLVSGWQLIGVEKAAPPFLEEREGDGLKEMGKRDMYSNAAVLHQGPHRQDQQGLPCGSGKR